MDTIAALATLTIMLAAAGIYVVLAWNNKATPIPSMWVLMLFMMGLSLWMYWSSPKHSWQGNVAVVGNFLNMFVILGGAIVANLRHHNFPWKPRTIEIQAFCLSALALLLWALTEQPLISYILVQCIAVFAYLPAVKFYGNARTTKEPWWIWLMVLVASVIAVIPGIIRLDLYAGIFLFRARENIESLNDIRSSMLKIDGTAQDIAHLLCKISHLVMTSLANL